MENLLFSFKIIELKTHVTFRIISSPETTKQMEIIHEEAIFKKLDIRQLRTVIPERWIKYKLSPTIAPVCCLERVSRPPFKDGEPQSRPS